jgi:hypothetical protein
VNRTVRILIQTTTPGGPDDWSAASFSLLAEHLASLRENGTRFEVTARNRESAPNSDDPVLGSLDLSPFDELWLFALDTGDGLTAADCQGITRFRQRGGGILATRDHQDMGISLCTLGGIGAAHHFQTKNPEPDPARLVSDDRGTPSISWPNYHSGNNGDFQRITRADPPHELLRNPDSASGWIEFFPSHPHEGAVDAPPEENARVIATGTSLATGRPFNLAVAFESRKDEAGNRLGRGVAESSFHHFADYNWDTSRGAPSFVSEPEGQGMRNEPRALLDIQRYVRNLAFWLAPAAGRSEALGEGARTMKEESHHG